uniref:Uncharacterized protein n=1 Tax=Amphimedon queenslandica TaxID=400682 RepID=A0A1X7V765_AMPQE
ASCSDGPVSDLCWTGQGHHSLYKYYQLNLNTFSHLLIFSVRLVVTDACVKIGYRQGQPQPNMC